MTTFTTYRHAKISPSYLIQETKLCMQTGISMLKKKICREKTQIQIRYYSGTNTVFYVVLTILKKQWKVFSYLLPQHLQNVIFIQIICSTKAKAKDTVPMERLTFLILFLVFLQSEFVNSLLFVQNESIQSFHSYSILIVWFRLGFFFPSPASLKLSLLA